MHRPRLPFGPPLSAESGGERFDAIVIGSGMGGLAAGSLLAQVGGARVLLLERHYRLGGLLQEFTRPHSGCWSAGLHYVGEMRAEGRFRRFMDLVSGGVEWAPLPDPFERFVYPGLSVEQPVGEANYLETLSRLWPAERSGLLEYFATIRGVTRRLHAGVLTPDRTTRQVLEGCIGDPRLRAVLVSQWGNYGLPPSRSSFLAHAVAVSHYLDGGWFPLGGTAPLIDGARAAIERAGGECRGSSEVASILVEGDRAVGVAVYEAGGRRTRSVRAPLVISAAGARATYTRLLRAHDSAELRKIRAWLDRLGPSYTVVQLFLGLRDQPGRLGIRGENLWIFRDWDHEAMYRGRAELLNGRARGAFLSFPSCRDPAAERHTAEVIAPVSAKAFRTWAERPWRRRGTEYEAVKERIANALLALVEPHVPGLTSAVAYRELATPLTIEHFTGHADGAAYGLPATPARFAGPGAGAGTPIRGLFLAGSDASVHGVVGAMMGGVAAVASALGPDGMGRILGAAASPTGMAE